MTPPTLGLRHRAACGFSLVEALVALGLVAWAFLGIGGLVLVSSGLVRAARSHTVALAVARGALEGLCSGGFDGTWGRLGLDGSAAAATVDSRADAWAAPWQRVLAASLADAHAEIELHSIAPSASVPLREADAIRVTVTVLWSDGRRARRIRLATVRT